MKKQLSKSKTSHASCATQQLHFGSGKLHGFYTRHVEEAAALQYLIQACCFIIDECNLVKWKRALS